MFSHHRLVLILLLLLAQSASAEFPTTQPYAGVRYRHEKRSDPPMSLYIVQIDLLNPDVSVRIVPGGPDPDGEGEYETTLMVPSEIARREAFDICVNASFFSAANPPGAPLGPGYLPGKWSNAVGLP